MQRSDIVKRFHRAMHRLILLSRLLKNTHIDPNEFSFDNLQNMREFMDTADDETIMDERMTRVMTENILSKINYRSLMKREYIEDIKIYLNKIRFKMRKHTSDL